MMPGWGSPAKSGAAASFPVTSAPRGSGRAPPFLPEPSLEPTRATPDTSVPGARPRRARARDRTPGHQWRRGRPASRSLALLQPRTVPARLQLPRPRPGHGRVGAAAGAAALPVHLLHQPRRVLRDPRRDRAPRAGLRHRTHAARRHGTDDGAPPHPRTRRRTRRRAVRLLEPGPVPGAGRGGRAGTRPRPVERAPDALAVRLLPQGDPAGALAAGAGPGPPVPEDPQ